MNRKLYRSALVVLLVGGALGFLVSTVVIIHDAFHYWTLPEPYRAAISKLDCGWHYAGLPKDENAAVLAMHQKWENEERMPWWGAFEMADNDEQRRETLKNFYAFVPRWGLAIHQQHPFTAFSLSFLFFVPFFFVLGISRWLLWLRAPT